MCARGRATRGGGGGGHAARVLKAVEVIFRVVKVVDDAGRVLEVAEGLGRLLDVLVVVEMTLCMPEAVEVVIHVMDVVGGGGGGPARGDFARWQRQSPILPVLLVLGLLELPVRVLVALELALEALVEVVLVEQVALELESLERLGESSWGRRIQSRSFCHEI